MALLQYRFSVVGMDQLNAALSAHRAQVKAHNRALAAELNSGLRTIQGGGATTAPRNARLSVAQQPSARGAESASSQKAAKAQAQEDLRVARQLDAGERALRKFEAQEAAKKARLEEQAATRAAAIKAREESRVARQLDSGERAIFLDKERAAKRAAMTAERESKQASARAVSTKAQEEARAARQLEADRKRAERDIAGEQRRQQGYWRQAQRASESERLRSEERVAAIRQRVSRERVGTALGVGRNVLGSIGTVGRVGVGLAAIGGGVSLAGSVQQRLENTRVAANLAAQAKAPGRTQEVMSAAEKVTGFGASEALQGLTQWQTLTGNLDLGLTQLQRWADLADDTSAGYADIASAAGTLFVGFESKIPDAKQRLDAVTETIRAMAAQGTAGSLELKDMSIGIGELWAAAQKFGSDPVRQMRQMGAIAQIYKGAGGLSASEALTTAQRIPDDIVQNVNKFRGAGVEVWQKGKEGVQMRELPELLADVFQKTGGRIDKIMKLGFDIRSKRGIEVLASQWREGEAKGKGGGRTALMQRISSFESLTRSDADIAKGAAGRREQSDKVFEARVRQIGRQMGEAALPEINKLAETLTQLTPTIIDATKAFLGLVNWFASNPLSGVAAIMGGAILKEVASASIGAAISKVLATSVGGMAAQAAGGLTGAANAGTAMATSGAAASGALWKLGLAAAAIPAAMAAIDQARDLHALTGGFKTEAQMNREARVKAGLMTPEQALAMEKSQKGAFGKSYDVLTGATDEKKLRDYQMLEWMGKSDRVRQDRERVELEQAKIAAGTEEGYGYAITRVSEVNGVSVPETTKTGPSNAPTMGTLIGNLESVTANMKDASAALAKTALNRSDKPSPGWPG